VERGVSGRCRKDRLTPATATGNTALGPDRFRNIVVIGIVIGIVVVFVICLDAFIGVFIAFFAGMAWGSGMETFVCFFVAVLPPVAPEPVVFQAGGLSLGADAVFSADFLAVAEKPVIALLILFAFAIDGVGKAGRLFGKGI
jgi:hypothetical protein